MGRQVCWPDWPSFFFFFPLSPTIFPQFFLLQAPWSRSCTALCSPCDHPLMRLPQSQNDLSCIPQVLHPCRWLLSIAWRDFRECLFLLSTFLPFFSSSIFWGAYDTSAFQLHLRLFSKPHWSWSNSSSYPVMIIIIDFLWQTASIHSVQVYTSILDAHSLKILFFFFPFILSR